MDFNINLIAEMSRSFEAEPAADPLINVTLSCPALDCRSASATSCVTRVSLPWLARAKVLLLSLMIFCQPALASESCAIFLVLSALAVALVVVSTTFCSI
jgi:hypothetical protein